MLVLYISYEFSLLPIVYIIVTWGSYPDRSLRALILLIYTGLFSLPLIGGLFYLYSTYFTFFFGLSYSSSFSLSPLLRIFIFFSFCVKLPIYGLHFWLPIAHVEAPTFGSIILAGILLKLGGMGLIRFFCFLDYLVVKNYFLAYFLIFLVFRTIICCMQSDFKRLIAYSSVSHIIAVPLVILSGSSLGLKASVLLMVFHGLSSPLLFALVGILYGLFSSRQLVLIRGLLLLSPLLSVLCIISFFFSLSAPPYVSFFSEVLLFICRLAITPFSLPPLLLFAFFSMVYGLNWLSSVIFSFPTVSSFSLITPFSLSLPLFLIHFYSLLFLFIVPLF